MDAWVEAHGTQRAELLDNRCAVRDPEVARVIFDKAFDMCRGCVDEAQLCTVVAIQAASRPNPHATRAVLVNAERLFAVVAVGLGHGRPPVTGISKQPVTGCCPDRSAPIFEERVDARRCTVGWGVARDAVTIDAGHAFAACEGDPDTTLRGTSKRGNGMGRQRAATASRPGL